MNLYNLLQARAENGERVRAGLIGAGKFGSMFLSQVPTINGLDVPIIADLDVDGAKSACTAVGWPDELIATTRYVDSGEELIASGQADVIIDATGHPAAGLTHALLALETPPAYGDGQCGGRCSGRASVGGEIPCCRTCVFHGLWRSAGAHL